MNRVNLKRLQTVLLETPPEKFIQDDFGIRLNESGLLFIDPCGCVARHAYNAFKKELEPLLRSPEVVRVRPSFHKILSALNVWLGLDDPYKADYLCTCAARVKEVAKKLGLPEPVLFGPQDAAIRIQHLLDLTS